jgi:hypothetical protein
MYAKTIFLRVEGARRLIGRHLGESLQQCFHYFNGWCIISPRCKRCTSWIEDGTTEVMYDGHDGASTEART